MRAVPRAPAFSFAGSSTGSHFLDVEQQVGRVLEDAKGAGLLKLGEPIAAAQETDAQRSATLRRDHILSAVAATIALRLVEAPHELVGKPDLLLAALAPGGRQHVLGQRPVEVAA